MLLVAKFRPPMPTIAGMPAIREGLVPWRYTVALYKPGASKWGGFMIGTVVTHLSINDWCDLHGYQLVEKSETREALADERTALD